MPLAFPVLVFDFDYTLADSSSGVIKAINYALHRSALPEQSPEAIRATIGLSLPKTFAALLGQPPEDTATLVHDFVAHADRIMNENTRLLPGAAETIQCLKRRGHRLGIVSNKYRYRIEGVLAREGLSNLFGTVVGREDFSVHKPDPEGLHLAMRQLQAVPDMILYIGDSETDAQTAQRANVPFIGILSGVTTRAQLSSYVHCDILPSVAQLPAWLEQADKTKEPCP